ncbi:MAG: hypothetical protein WD269_00100 [Acidimicrobiia bacterium]
MGATAPGKEHPAYHRRMLLLAGLAGAVLIVAALVLAATVGETPSSGPGDGGTETNAAPDTESVSQDVTGDSNEGVIGSSEDPITVGVDAACAMFHQGATVAEFAAWFEADVGDVGTAEEELFRAILLEALTERCPEVIATEA